MGCDHLDVGHFRDSMSIVDERYNDIYNYYKKDLKNAFDSMKKAWNTPKGWNRVQDYANKLAETMEKLAISVEGNYELMRKSATEWAKSQQVWMFFIKEIPMRKFELYDAGKHEGELNEVKKEEVKDAADRIKIVMNNMCTAIGFIELCAQNDDLFGYYSTQGDYNPREELNKAMHKLKNDVQEAFDGYANNMNQAIDEDNAARESAIEKAIDNMSNKVSKEVDGTSTKYK